jgi:hypothetical protein
MKLRVPRKLKKRLGLKKVDYETAADAWSAYEKTYWLDEYGELGEWDNCIRHEDHLVYYVSYSI